MSADFFTVFSDGTLSLVLPRSGMGVRVSNASYRRGVKATEKTGKVQQTRVLREAARDLRRLQKKHTFEVLAYPATLVIEYGFSI